MLPSNGILFILLPVSLWWTRSNGHSSTLSPTNTDNSSTTDTTRPTHQGTSHQLGLTGTNGITPPTMTKKNATTKSTVIESNTQSNSVTQRSTNGTELFLTSHVDKGSTNTSARNVNRTSPSSTISITMSDFSTATESNMPTNAGVSSKTEAKNFTSVTYKTSSTATISTKDSLKSSTEVSSTNSPSNTLTTLSTNKSGSVTTDFKTISQTTKNVYQNFTNHSMVPSNPKEPNKDNRQSAGVVLGAIVGAILGSALIGLIGYFICGKRKSGSFSHQRLYDDTRSDPVLRLDNSSHDVSFGDLSYYNPSTTNEPAAQNSRGRPYDGIPMGDMTSSQPSA
ncbi:mucin 15, cell surface associated [Chelydra serpentina]|uniref:Mucin 15, cell surface associated n=1 Tax=Chelydra serpentina TaxID=8475 RepID=A0A8T1T3D4_CHESE|nr:mucin 15, cell surface associated [Chelydra serpentina]